MNYCSLEDAFQLAPGCKSDYSSKEARKDERKKARRCRGPPLSFLEIQDKDPDRQHLEKPKEVPVMNSKTGLKYHQPVTQAWNEWSEPANVHVNGVMEPFQDVTGNPKDGIETDLVKQRMAELLPRTDEDPVGDSVRSTLPTPAMLAQASAPLKKKYFGADPNEENFADYLPNAKNYLMEPNFTTAFKNLNPGSSSEISSVLPIPSVRDVWKPLTTSGVDTAFFNRLPPDGGLFPGNDSGLSTSQRKHDESYQSMSRKIDRIMERLESLQKGPSAEQSQTEVLMFVSSGVFILFLMDLLVRKGSSMRFLSGL
jgi:hypothetical protein